MFKKAPSNTLPNLGELELRLLNLLWEEPGLSAKDAHQRLGTHSSANTIQSALERLFRKGLLDREKQSHAYTYRAKVKRAELTTTLIGAVIDKLQLGSLDPVLNSFVDFAAGMDDDTLNRLERLIQERKQQRTQDHD